MIGKNQELPGGIIASFLEMTLTDDRLRMETRRKSMGIASKAGIFLILSLSILLNTTLLKSDSQSIKEESLTLQAASEIDGSLALFLTELRSGPSTEHPILCIIPEGASVQYLYSDHKGWNFVWYEGLSGYLPDRKTADSLADALSLNREIAFSGRNENVPSSSDDLQMPLPETPLKGTRSFGHVKTTTVYYPLKDVDFFDKAGAGRSRIQIIPQGTHLISQADADGWHQVIYGGKTGWVKASLLDSSEVDMVDGIIIANKGYELPKDFSPGRNPEAYDAFLQMRQDASKEGITLRLSTTYRSYSAQQHIYRTFVNRAGKERADTYSARAGYSEHQTGLAFDIGGANPDFRLKQALGSMKEGLWMAKNAPGYGFILRYPKGKQDMTGYMYEPWHFRYVGVTLALRITETGLTLDEYLGVVAPDYAIEP